MKIELNEHEFKSNINSSSIEKHNEHFEKGKRAVAENAGLILGMVSLALALFNLPFGLFMNFSTEILSKLTEHGLQHWIFALFIVTAVVILHSIICGVISVVLFVKSKKRISDCVGFIVSIVSFVLCMVCLALNIVGIVAW